MNRWLDIAETLFGLSMIASAVMAAVAIPPMLVAAMVSLVGKMMGVE